MYTCEALFVPVLSGVYLVLTMVKKHQHNDCIPGLKGIRLQSHLGREQRTVMGVPQPACSFLPVGGDFLCGLPASLSLHSLVAE